MDICEYVCIYAHTYIKMRIANWRGSPREATGAHGSRKKAYFFSFSPLENALLRVKNAQKSWLSELLVSGHGRFRIVIIEILGNISCSYEYIYVYVYVCIYICMDICEYVCIYAHIYIKMRIVNWRGSPRQAAGAHGCPRVSKKRRFSRFHH